MREKFEAAIIRFLNERFDKSVVEGDIDWNGNMFDAGYLNSLDIYLLLPHLEEELSISLPLSDLIDDFPEFFNELHARILHK